MRPVESGFCHDHPLEEDEDAPAGLGEYGAELWRRLYWPARRAGIIGDLDETLLETLCVQWQMMQKAKEDIDSEGRTVQGAKGRKAHPSMSLYKSAGKEVRQLLSEMGLTPTSRTRLDLTGDEEETDDPFAEAISE